MKHIIFCTYPSIYSSIVLQQLLNSQHIHVDAIIASTVTKKNSRFPSLSILKNSGLRYASYLWIITTLFGLLPRKRLLSVPEMAKNKDIPYFKTSDINNKTSLSFLKQHPASHLLSAHFNQIIDTSLSGFSERQCINIHPSLLPKNKGLDPVFYALLREETQQGITLHSISDDIDGGDIYAQQEMETLLGSSLFTVNTQLFEMGSKLFIQVLDIEKDAMPQDTEGNYDSWPQRKDCRKVNNMINLRHFFSTIY
ncbi:MAG: Unknown protein [uncultured Thiotrichaceae bacterium]|uniref:Formyl transferase N-terminal domain-containing protein n=1 Tax=uncultured Thiotrichaceae bacterium TaxID=298394 RepID=A0A6S6STK1_9GAMM|nr:MAG: Unknown protein [uncultured Thiotrichaceae bacterium]